MSRPFRDRAFVRVAALAAGLSAIGGSGSRAAAVQHHDLGTVRFPTSCQPAVQAEFERGVAMLHSYWFNYAGKTFRAVLEKDPSCAMAYWGIALDLLGNTLAAAPTAARAREAWSALEQARPLDATPRERHWIDAIRTYFRDHERVPLATRLTAYSRAMGEIAQKYPDDFEAQVFYALTLQAAAPKNDLTYASQLKSAGLLEKLYAANPQHPGITHYLIHAYDFAPFADKGVAAARRYASIAPAVPHARHMPAHIYSMVGLWQDSIQSNLAALEIQPDYYHAFDFIVYAHLQLTEDQQAARMFDQAGRTPERGDRPVTIADYTARAAMPARIALERADWARAAALAVTSTAYPQADAISRFARGLGMARLGNTSGARAEIAALNALRATLLKSGESYWADRVQEQVLAVSAWSSLADGAPAKAIETMRRAADGEDGSLKHVAMENRLYPMRELLGDLLLEAGKPADAYAEYVKAVRQHPNRFRALYGAARAAEDAGDRPNAASYYAQVIELSSRGDGTRDEVKRAKAYGMQ
jgi:tetratricopeptide (TPR) repeat protein